MQITDIHPDDYLDTIEADDARDTMMALDEIVRAALVGRSRDLWEGKFWGGTDQTIIGYGHLVQPRSRGGSVEWFVVGLAKQSRHYSVYVNAVADGAYLGARYADRLGRVKLGAASIGFTSLDRIDLAVLAELLREADRITPP